ncbi:unnamed protein product [Bursaphelenchus xylophilus]|nr:unnamed protein product [Bursaphelenchus xylophilus]CAG9097468.1 unnamed protein product [Bursaphelenchus xylophilus]
MNGTTGQNVNNRRRRPNHHQSNQENINQGPLYGGPPSGFEPQDQHRNHNRPRRGRGGPSGGGRRGGGGNLHARFIKERRDHNGKPMEGQIEDCDVCCQKSDVFGIGKCLHPACMECVIRMRCLGEQKSCHACRAELDKLYFVRKPVDWKYSLPSNAIVRHPDCGLFNIAFEDAYTLECYEKYNLFSCRVCEKKGEFSEFPTFPALKQHVTTHGLTFCHICLEHLNVLTKDRELYNQDDLKKHMNGEKGRYEGFKGHPQCDFCHQRFYDDEFLYRHLRKEHFYCSLCESEMGKNVFFNRVEQLHRHYKKEHHPCLHQDCLAMGIVFKNEMELNVHNAQHHSEGNRSIPVDFQFNRNISRFGESSGRNTSAVHSNSSSGVSVIPAREAVINAPRQAIIIPSAQFTRQQPRTVPAPPRVEIGDFPSLGPPSSAVNGTNWRASVQSSRQAQANSAPSKPLDLASQFPSLGPSNSAASVSSGTSWGTKNIASVLRQPAQRPQKPSTSNVQRKKLVPLPDIWPENMQKKLEAREQGLPEPTDEDPPLPDPHVVLAKKKEPKKKTVKASTVMEKVKPTPLAANNSKFNVFSSVDNDDNEEVATEEWLSSTAMKAKLKKKIAKQEEKEKLMEERRKKKEEEEKKLQEKLTLEKFLHEKKERESAEAARKLEEVKVWDGEQDSEDMPGSSRPKNPEDTDDPLLKALLENHKKYAEERTGPQSALDRIKALTGWFGESKEDKSAEPPRPNTTDDLGSASRVAPPPGFEKLSVSKPPGF